MAAGQVAAVAMGDPLAAAISRQIMGPLQPTIYGLTPGQSEYAFASGLTATITSGANLSSSDTIAYKALIKRRVGQRE